MVRTLAAYLLALLIMPSQAIAHTLGEGYLFIDVTDDKLSGRFEITLTDLDVALAIDGDQDGKVVEQDVENNLQLIKDYLVGRLSISDGQRDYQLVFNDYKLLKIPLGQYLDITFETDATSVPDELTFAYSVLFDKDPEHRGFLVVASNGKSGVVNEGEDVSLIFTPETNSKAINLRDTSMWSSFGDFVKHGVWHIWIGIDHILFLVALILPAVLIRSDRSWLPVDSFGSAAWNVVKIVTLFTVAHTITLTLAALEIVQLNSRFVESVIAASVAFAALNNVVPILKRNIGWVVFGFGLFHGFGFASVLQHLTSNTRNLIGDLLGFNIGVELGQLAIVLVLLPVLFLIRRSRAYIPGILTAGSVVIGLIAVAWLIERTADVSFLPI